VEPELAAPSRTEPPKKAVERKRASKATKATRRKGRKDAD
jgi:hypothetical protein